MRWSHALIPTLKETPADAVAPSHVLLLRAGMIRQLGAGTYTYMPLGLRVLQKAMRIVREEMDAAGALELLMPALQPVELWKESGRFEAYGDLLMKLTISGGHQMALGPTHEEVITEMVRDLVRFVQAAPDHALPDPDQVPRRAAAPVRHRADPRIHHEGRVQHRRRPRPAQLQLRQDVRGLLPDLRPLRPPLRDRRGRERTDRRRLVARVHGPLLDRRGQGHLLREVRLCGQPGARRGRRPRPVPTLTPDADAPAYEAVPTPGKRTIREVCEFLGVEEPTSAKLLVYLADGKPAAALLRGDHELNEAKFRRAVGASSVVPADAATIEKATGAPMGFLGPVGIKIPMVIDRAIAAMPTVVVGGNAVDVHLKGRRAGPRLPARADPRHPQRRRRRPLPPLRHAAGGQVGPGDRPRLQAGDQVLEVDGRDLPRREGERDPRSSWGATGSGSTGSSRRPSRRRTTPTASSGRCRSRPITCCSCRSRSRTRP